MGNLFKNIGHSISKGSKSIGHVFSKGEHKIEGAVSDVYHDAKGAVKYTGKHLINDVDTVSNTLSSPLLWIAGGALVLFVMSQRR